MGTLEKQKRRLKSKPKDYTYSELKTLLGRLGYVEYNKGKSSGSRVCFYKQETNKIIMLHKPHPGDIVDVGAVKSIVANLEECGEI